jgi:multidrug transporter EmrE-like cation transporter
MATIHPYFLVLLCVLLNVASQIFLKVGVHALGPPTLEMTHLLAFGVKLLSNPSILMGGIMLLMGFAIWLIVLTHLEVSLAYPLFSMGYVILPLVSYFFLGESLPPLRILGIVTIMLGVYLISKT